MSYDRSSPYRACLSCGQPTRSLIQICRSNAECRCANDKARRNEDIEAYRTKVREGNRVRAAAWRKANPDREAAKGKRWRDANREYCHEKSRKWREANPERVAETARAWTKANPEKNQEKERRRRSLKMGVPSAAVNRDLLILLQNNKCTLCGTPLAGRLEIDHIIPLSLGGWDVPGNLALTHERCNRRKNNRADLSSPECVEANLRARLFVQRCPDLVSFPSGGDYSK